MGPPLQVNPCWDCGPLLSEGPSGSSLPSGCFWACMARLTISLFSLPWAREVSGSFVCKTQHGIFSLRAPFTPSASLCLSLGAEDGPSLRPHCSCSPLGYGPLQPCFWEVDLSVWLQLCWVWVLGKVKAPISFLNHRDLALFPIMLSLIPSPHPFRALPMSKPGERPPSPPLPSPSHVQAVTVVHPF